MQKIDRINLYPQYICDHRKWSIKTSKSFVEGILLGYDSPKLYFALRSTNDYDMDVVDGTQRIEAISKFINNEFSVNLTYVYPTLNDVYFQELSDSAELLESFWSYSLTLVEYDSDDVDYLKRLRQFISQRPDYLEAVNCAPKRSSNPTLASTLTIPELNKILSEVINQTSCGKKNILPYALAIDHETNEQYQNEYERPNHTKPYSMID